MSRELNNIVQLIESLGIDPKKAKIENCTIMSINGDNTVNIISKGVPYFSIPSNRQTVGSAKMIITPDGTRHLL